MAYTVLARRYRSQSFDEIIGQETIARTLASAIKQARVAHAYLFVGTRGVGKTSMARIFAKALNGGAEDVDKAIMNGRDTDVIEIDAASNRGVDEARDLIAGSVIRPLRGGFKIYIIDEVHMLTREAFNALLKTMEEPPAHVKFILCTTEPQKVPATIQSRCQRFDFRNIPSKLIAEHLRQVVDKEGMQADSQLLSMVARMGAGSMRDALSLLDRLMASGEQTLTRQILERLLGLPGRELIGALVEAVAAGDAGAALVRTNEVLQRGVAIDQLLESIIDTLRDLMLLCACGESTELVDLTGDDRSHALTLSADFDAAGLVHMIALCTAAQRNVRMSSTPRAILDALIVRLSMSEHLADLAALLKTPAASRGAGRRAASTGAPSSSSTSQKKSKPPAPEPPALKHSSGKTSSSVAAPVCDNADETLDALWSKVQLRGGETAASRAILRAIRPISISDGVARLVVDDPSQLSFVRSREQSLEKLISEVVGKKIRIEFVETQSEQTQCADDEAGDDVKKALEHPLVQEVQKLFDATVVRVDQADTKDASSV